MIGRTALLLAACAFFLLLTAQTATLPAGVLTPTTTATDTPTSLPGTSTPPQQTRLRRRRPTSQISCLSRPMCPI